MLASLRSETELEDLRVKNKMKAIKQLFRYVLAKLSLKEKVAHICGIKKGDKAVSSQGDRKKKKIASGTCKGQ